MFNNTSFGNTSFGATSFGTPSGFGAGSGGGAGGFGTSSTLGAFGATNQQTQQQPQQIGTTIRFVPISGTDSLAKPNGGHTSITTRHQNISAMKEYENKSVEELRLEDYMANRKHGQPQSAFGTTPFGSMQPSTSQQNTSVFGTTTNQPISNIFSTPAQNQTTNLFGQPKNDFGVNNSSNLFNSSLNKPTTSVASSPFNIGTQFGATATSTAQTNSTFSIFNNNNQTTTTPFGTSTLNSPFKTNQSTSLFGQPNSNTTPASQPFGFPSTNTQPSNTSIFANNTSTGQTAQPFSFPSSNTQPSTSLFNTSLNNSIKPAFPAPSNTTTSIFGQQKTDNTFGATSGGSLFNSSLNKPATTIANSPFSIGNQFGNPSTSTAPAMSSFPLFNNNATQNTTPFGTSNINSPFKTNQTTSLFGQNTSQAQTSQPFGFTNSATTTSTTSSLFGNTTTTTQASQPFSFPSSNTQSNTSLFNTSLSNSIKPAFPGPSQSNSSFSFGQTQPNTSGLNTNSNTSGLFGNNNPVSNLSFGLQTNAGSNSFTQNSFLSNQSSNPLQTHNQMNKNPTSPQSSDLLLNRLKTLPYGETSLLLNDTATSSSSGKLKFTTDPAVINQYKMNAKTNVKLNKPQSAEKPTGNPILFDGLDENTNDDMRCAIDVFIPKRNIKKLDISSVSHLSEGDADKSTESHNFSRQNLQANRLSTPTTRHVRYADNTVPGLGEYDNVSFSRNQTILSNSGSDVSSLRSFNRSGQLENLTDLVNDNLSYKCGFVNSRPDYKVKPSLDEMEKRYNPADDTCFVDSLIIERPDYGSILFESRINVKGINIDDIVHIRRKEVIVYPDDENKPPIGRGLNRPAIVSLHQVWPIDKSTNEVIKDVNRLRLMKYPDKIESATIEKGARFIEYRPETGTWMFAVKHFSKYGITDDDEDFVLPEPTQQQQPQTQPLPMAAPLQQLNHTSQNIMQTPVNSGNILNRLKGSTFHDQISQTVQIPAKSILTKSSIPTKANSETKSQSYKMNTKTSIKLDNSLTSEKPQSVAKNESLFFENTYDSSYSMKNALDEFFTDDEAISNRPDIKRSLSVHGTKRRALLNASPNTSLPSLAITTVATVPQQQKVREIKLKPDLYAARNKLTRDIMSTCVAGTPKVRFFYGSRSMSIILNNDVKIYELKLIPTDNDGSLATEVKERFEVFLESHTRIKTSGASSCAIPYLETEDYVTEASSHDLLHALYGQLTTETPYAKQDERLTRVVNWLAAINRTISEPKGLYQAILYHMSCDRYDLAAEIAIDNNHPRLALLVGTFNLNKRVMTDQLTSWRLSRADQFIDHDLLKIYVILSGQTEWKLSNDITIKSLKGLKWTQQLCLLALHVPPFITEPEKYYGFHMLPLHIRRLDTDTNDVDYHILARHSPADILSACHTLVEEWFLSESLKSFHVINDNVESMQSDMIHTNLAAQLGSIDLRWACFVALHIVNNDTRNHVLTTCLEQNYDQLTQTKMDSNKPNPVVVENWLIERLKLPTSLIENAKRIAKVN